jgi:predicted nucleic acid-binding protein
MSKKKTYIDAGVLIAGVRGKQDLADRAIEVLDDPNRECASSAFLKLEVLPRAVHAKRQVEVAFYEAFFTEVLYWAEASGSLVEEALRQGNTHGLAALDALHVAAAISIGADESVTTEKPEKPIHQVKAGKVISIQT